MKKFRFCMVMVSLVMAVMFLTGCITTGSSGAKSETVAPKVALNILNPDKVGDSLDAGFINKWHVLGPFSFETKRYKKVEEGCQEALDDPFVTDEALLMKGAIISNTGGRRWQAVDIAKDFGDGNLDLNYLFDDPDYVAAYCIANVKSSKAIKNCRLLMGSDDYMKVWVNGKLVHTWNEDLRASYPDEDNVEGVSLNKGWNTILVKSVDVYGGWGIYCRITNKDEKGYEIK